ncbi:MAG: 23S rRNA (adenine(2030)-N(6))-methyltransferase RlmJ [Nibricoccus sp.]
MNYRHHFHAGNFADVVKHVLLVQLVRGMQRKEKGFLFLDTHAGRGRYDLTAAARGDSLERKPEHPDGIGRLWNRAGLPEPVAEYVSLVREFDRVSGGKGEQPQFYPGSPRLVQAVLRGQDRVALCEKHPEEFAALKDEFRRDRRASVQQLDGYTALRAMLPPPEKRALVLIDPPFEEQNEFAQIVDGLREGLRRMPACTFAVWYPLTERARVDAFFEELLPMNLPPTFAAEVMIAGEASVIKMKGCGLLVINPPWQIDRVISPVLPELAEILQQAPGAHGELRWLVSE